MGVHTCYRYRTFAERLGRKNAKKIILHYIGVLIVVYLILKIRSSTISYSEDKCM